MRHSTALSRSEQPPFTSKPEAGLLVTRDYFDYLDRESQEPAAQPDATMVELFRAARVIHQ